MCWQCLKSDLGEDAHAQSLLVLTPNNYLAATVKDAQVIAQDTGYNFPVYSLNLWLENLWNRWASQLAIQDKPNLNTCNPLSFSLLSSAQEKFLLQNIIDKHSTDNLFFNTDMLSMLLDTWYTIKQHKIDLQHDEFSMRNDSVFAQKVLTHWLSFCATHQYIDRASLIDCIGISFKHIQQDMAHLVPSKIYLLGFRELTAQQQQFFTNLARENIEIVDAPCTCKYTSSHFSLTDLSHDDEISAIASYIEHMTLDKAHQSVGVVINEPDKVALLSKLSSMDIVPYSYTMNAEQSVLAQHTQAVLALTHSVVEISVFKQLLLSPYLFNKISLTDYADIEKALAELCVDEISVLDLCTNLKHISSIAKYLTAISHLLELNQHKLLLPSVWVRVLFSILKICDWPGLERLTKSQQRSISCIYSIFDNMCGLDKVSPKLSFNSAYIWFNKLFSNAKIQHTNPVSNVHILDVVTASSFAVDNLWIADFHTQKFLQDKLHTSFIPHILLDKVVPDYAYQQDLLKQIYEHVKHELVVSCLHSKQPHLDIQEFKDYDLNQLQHRHNSLKIADEAALEIVKDNYKGNFHNQENIIDIGVINAQAGCPFKAFAHYRLGIEDRATSTSMALSKATIGTLLHQVLAKFWNEVKNSQNLAAMSDTAQSLLIQHIISDLIASNYPTHVLSGVLQVFTANIANRWINYEREREIDFVVIAIEKSYQLELDNAVLNVRIDRIDKLSTGDIVIVDYKTGNFSATDWLGDRPDNVQLPVYIDVIASHYTQDISAVYAAVLKEKIGFAGISQHLEMQHLNSVSAKKCLSDIVNNNLENIYKIVAEYVAGEANITPKNSKTCNYCNLSSLCRIKS